MDILDQQLDVDCAFVDKNSLNKYKKEDFVDGIRSLNTKYTRAALNMLKKNDLIVLYCKEKGYKLVDGRTSLHFPGKV